MPRLESAKRLMRRWLTSIPFFVLLGLGLGVLISIPVIPKPNIATHEFGHPTGLDDLYDEIYSELTMYGYSSKGETKKCSLEIGDIAGAQKLYGTP